MAEMSYAYAGGSSKNSYIMRIESMYVSIQGTSNLKIIGLFENIMCLSLYNYLS